MRIFGWQFCRIFGADEDIALAVLELAGEDAWRL